MASTWHMVRSCGNTKIMCNSCVDRLRFDQKFKPTCHLIRVLLAAAGKIMVIIYVAQKIIAYSIWFRARIRRQTVANVLGISHTSPNAQPQKLLRSIFAIVTQTPTNYFDHFLSRHTVNAFEKKTMRKNCREFSCRRLFYSSTILSIDGKLRKLSELLLSSAAVKHLRKFFFFIRRFSLHLSIACASQSKALFIELNYHEHDIATGNGAAQEEKTTRKKQHTRLALYKRKQQQ